MKQTIISKEVISQGIQDAVGNIIFYLFLGCLIAGIICYIFSTDFLGSWLGITIILSVLVFLIIKLIKHKQKLKLMR